MRRFLAGALAFLTLAVCLWLQAVLSALPPRLLIPGLLDFTHAFNRGVSFSLLWQTGDAGRYLLVGTLLVLTVGVAVLAWRAANGLAAAGFGFILGGALANLADRLRSGAVFDYLALHLGTLPLFVCNAADIAISLGVILLVADGLWAAKPRWISGRPRP